MISKVWVAVFLVCAVMANRELKALTSIFDRVASINFQPFQSLVPVPSVPPSQSDPNRFDGIVFDLNQDGDFQDNEANCDTAGCQANAGIIVDFEDYLNNGFTGSVLVENLAKDNKANCVGDKCFANSGVTLLNVQADDGRVNFQNGASGNEAVCNGTECVANSGILRLGEGVDAVLFG